MFCTLVHTIKFSKKKKEGREGGREVGREGGREGGRGKYRRGEKCGEDAKGKGGRKRESGKVTYMLISR